MKAVIKLEPGCESGSKYCKGCNLDIPSHSTYVDQGVYHKEHHCYAFDYVVLHRKRRKYLRCKQCLEAEQEAKP